MTDRYIELHANSAFNFLQGASLPETLVFRAQQLEYPAMALMDGNGVYGSPRFHLAATPNGIQAHVGSEIAVRDLGSRLTPPEWVPHQHPAEPVRLPLLCESREGYQNLCRMVTRLKMREPSKAEGSATVADVEEFAKGLVCLTGGEEGPLAAALARGGEKEGYNTVKRLVSMFGSRNVYVELQRHGQREQEWRNQAAVRIAQTLGLPILATNGVRYADERDREIADLFTAIRNHVSLEKAGRLLATNASRHLRPAKEMIALFRDLPEATANTWELSQRLTFQMDDLGYEFPRYPVPEGESMDSFLEKLVREGVIKRYGAKNDASLYARAQKQVQNELALIKKLGLAGYFLIVWDIIHYCQRNDILVQGRGSAANSAVCYALEITAVDPVGMELAVRALPEREPRRVARHRSGFALGRQARKGDPIRVPALWAIRRSDDCKRDHLSRQVSGARGRQSIGLRHRDPEQTHQAGKQLGVEGSERHAREPVLQRRLRGAASAHREVSRPLPAHSGHATTSGAAFGRDGDLPGATGQRGSDRTRVDAGTFGSAVGQGRLRRHEDYQGRSAGVGDDGGDQGLH